MTYLLAYDIGSTGCKTCLYGLEEKLQLIASSLEEYRFTTLANGGVEQDPDAWWEAMCSTTAGILAEAKVAAGQIEGISFCAQMQGLVLVDADLRPVRPAMSYMDQRSVEQKKRLIEHGLKIEGMNIPMLLKSLRINGAAPASVKDPIWKYKWVEEHEPECFARAAKWLDVKDYLIARATGEATMTRDSAFATFLTDERRQPSRWSGGLLRMYGIRPDHMPRLIDATDTPGGLTAAAAGELGLKAGTPVFGGGGDASMITIGAGATEAGDTYVYTGTSGWVSSTVSKRKVDVSRRIASIVGAQPGLYNYFAEQETAGKCLEWVKNHLALDEINLYLEKQPVSCGPEQRYKSLYDFLIETIEDVPPGAEGVIFTPWLHGNRSPFEDPMARGIFFNLGLETGKRKMIRAVVEGIIFHQKWLLEAVEKGFPVQDPIRFAGGGALSPVVSGILADILEHTVETVENPQNCGVSGAALTAAVGLGRIEDFKQVKRYIPIASTHYPRRENREIYRRQYSVFTSLYRTNKRLFAFLNNTGGQAWQHGLPGGTL